jgi:mannose-6-phosphate isomerase-like protein (cupin superfamily)
MENPDGKTEPPDYDAMMIAKVEGDARPGETGHNKPKYDWPRHTRKRTFVRALEGTYAHLLGMVQQQPRVYSSKDFRWEGGPQSYGKPVINPMSVDIAQSIETHFHAFAPKGYNKKHGHMNSAVFYVLRGFGHDIHDGERYDYEAGDCLIVENGCVHQHFNDSETEEMLCLIMKAKPLFLFMHLIFQKVVEYPPKDPVPGHEDYTPPSTL